MTKMQGNLQGNIELHVENAEIKGFQRVSTFRRILPQFFGSLSRSLIGTNSGQYEGLVAFMIPALTGLNKELNPDETLEITAVQASWLPTISDITSPIGSLLGGAFGDAIGRRKALIFVNVLFLFAWIILGFSETYSMICATFLLFGFIFGVNEPSLITYGTEIWYNSIEFYEIDKRNITIFIIIFILEYCEIQ